MKRAFLIVGAVLIIGIFVVFFAGKVQYVDPKPAVALGEQYFSKLMSGRTQEAYAMYSDEFLSKHGAQWQKLLDDLDAKCGTISGYTLLSTKVVPLTTPTGELPCTSARYHVARKTIPLVETLVICPKDFKAEMEIAGHELTRMDTGQTIRAGATYKEYEFFSIGSKPNVETQTDFEIARKAADELYRRVSDEDYGAIWDAAHDDLKASVGRDQMVTALRQWNEQLGVCRPPVLIDTDYANQNGEHFVGLIYSRECEHDTTHEKLAWKIVNGRALLRGYH